MKKVISLLLIALLLGTAVPMISAQEGGACDLEAPEEATTVNMIGWTYQIIEFYADELEGCNEVDNLEVNTQLLTSGDAHDQLRLALGAGGTSPYDIIMVTRADIFNYVDQEWLLPLDDLIAQYDEEYDISGIAGLDDMAVDGVVYGIPMEFNTRHLFYRPDILEAFGLEVPETYDDIIAACEVLTDEELVEEVLDEDQRFDLPFTINLHAGWAWRIEFADMLYGFGGQPINEDNTPAFNSEEGVMALEKLLEIVDACMGEEGLTYSIDDSQIAMATGSLPMMQTWATRAGQMDDPDYSDYVGVIEFAPMPRAFEDAENVAVAGPAVGAGLAIPATSDVDPELAFQIIMEALDLESQTVAGSMGVPSRGEVTTARNLQAVLETNELAVMGNSAPVIGAVLNPVWDQWLPQIMTGEYTVEELLAAAEEAYIAEATAQGFIEE